ncbi:efflux transporter outer membrane subunit [Aeoliella mucimassa]|uniref:Outer membrane protein OprM n=1 Tax=Aeoliella mucimassa TaxID=2527972 RepID=A0A518ARA1_9BACT|nr:efflux transporter outer membrane subunit [Aeoliella mucimassa]QDU57248.1 Outer membrane protein OprM precursor [Aeoliella mucimassa]
MEVKQFLPFGRRIPLAVVSVVMLCTASGCLTGPKQWIQQRFKVGPEYCRPATPVASDWIDADDPSVVSACADYSNWWRVFDDPTLNALEEEAASQNLQLRQAAMRVVEARALLNTARGTLFPQSQQATGSFAHIKNSETNANQFPAVEYDQWGAGFNASWELDMWGRFRRLVEAAEANYESSIYSYDDVLVILQGELASAYIQMRTLEERLDIVQENVVLQQQTLELAQKRFENGRVSELDVAQAATSLNATKAAIPPLEESIRKTQNAICVLLGSAPEDLAGYLEQTGIPTPPEQVVVGIPAELLRRRPDVRQAEQQVALQSALVGFTEANLYPHFALTGSIGVEAAKISDLFRSESLVGSVGPGFQWDILNYGRLINGYRAQQARLQEAVLGYQQAVLNADRSVEDAIISYLKEKERVELLRESVVNAERSVDIATLQYREGKADFQRVIDTQRVLVTRQEELAASRGRVNVNLVSVYKELGGGWQTRCQNSGAGATLAVDPTSTTIPALSPTMSTEPASDSSEPTPATDEVDAAVTTEIALPVDLLLTLE